MKVEVPLLGLMLAFIAWRHGVQSRQFWGAVGGFSPDIENGLDIFGVLPATIYPTHTKFSWFVGHGYKVKTILPQLLLIAASLLAAERSER
jgi:hypothetical protein